MNEAKHSDYKVYRAMRKYSITLENFSIEEDNILTEEEADIRKVIRGVNKEIKKNRKERPYKDINISCIMEI